MAVMTTDLFAGLCKKLQWQEQYFLMVSLYKKRDANKYEKHVQKMYRDVGMAVPKTTETRCRDGSVQGRHVIQRLHN